ncbi:MAG: haloacid dehalogenase type II, partial [Myxococcota bacterium]
MPVEVCVFDAYGTLFDVHSASRALAPQIPDAERLSRIWREKQLQYTWLRALMHRYASFWQVVQDGLDYAMAACELEDPTLRSELLALFERLDAYPEVPDILDALRSRGLRTAILSNGSPEMLASATEASGIASKLDAVLSVEPVKTFKPDPRVYAMAETHFGLP